MTLSKIYEKIFRKPYKLDLMFITFGFILGLIVSIILFLIFMISQIEIENPSSFYYSLGKPIPADFVNTSQIEIYTNYIKIRIPNTSISHYADSGSMRPTLDKGTNGISIVPKSEKDIKVGMIATYERDNGDWIVHRVMKIHNDFNGKWYEFKGDNNPEPDERRVRFSDIKSITIALVY